ncbi:MAG TPA: F-box protein [Rhabdochlamydiaceae bacterium]|nr:F-box protein [Rhabdochlamydiaceae bacterium]
MAQAVHPHISSSSSLSRPTPSSHTPSKKSTSKPTNWKEMPEDILFKLSFFLSPEELAFASATCKLWNKFLNTEEMWKNQYETQGYPRGEKILNYKAVFKLPIPNAIYPAHYTTLFGLKVVNPKPLPPKMRFENNQLDPEDELGRTVEKTHIWTYSPTVEIDGRATRLTTDILKELVENPDQEYSAGFQNMAILNTSMNEDGWYLIREKIFKGTRGLRWERQTAIIQRKRYQPPSAPDVILTALIWRVLTGKYLFGGDVFSYTYTKAIVSERRGMRIGGFGPGSDLHVNYYMPGQFSDSEEADTGVVGVRYDSRGK